MTGGERADDAVADQKPIALVGLMGAGKTTIGRRLAKQLGVPFLDADQEIEKAAGRTVSDIFNELGEAAFREGERKVIARLLEGPRHVLATGGGAFMDPDSRALLLDRAIVVWLHADLELLMERVSRRDTRPLLRAGDPRETMQRLMKERYPVYEKAHITVESENGPHSRTVDTLIEALADYRTQQTPAS